MKKLLLTTITLSFTLIVFGQYSESYVKEQKEQYEKFIREHPYSQTPHYSEEELEEMPETDRPDLANQLNFLQTLDPVLGHPPVDGLTKAHMLTDKITLAKTKSKTAVSGITWTERGPDNIGGRTRALMFDPNDATGKTVFAGGVSGGLWKNTNITSSTNSWTSINDFWDNLAITCLAYDASNTQVMYAGTGEGFYNVDAVAGAGIWKSTNGGSSWSQLASTNNSSFTYVQKIVVHPSTGDVYACTRNSGVMRSQDGGSTWSKVLGSGAGGSTNKAADIEIGADNTIYASLGIFSTDGIYSSSNGNSGSWTKLNTGSNGFPSSGIRRIEIACAPSNANVVYAVAQNTGSNVKGIYKSTNKGSTWSSVTMPSDADGGVSPDYTRGQAWYDLILAVDPNSASTVWIGGIDIFKSTNSGSSWSQITHWYGGFGFQDVHADQHAMVYRPGSSSQMVFGNDGGVFYTSNANNSMPTLSSRNSGYNVTQFYAGGINPTSGSNNMIAGAQDNGTHKFTSAGMNSTTEVTGGDGAFCHIDQTNGSNQISQYVYNVIYRTTNNWSGGSQIYNDQTTGIFINPSDLDSDEGIYYSCATSTSILRIKNVFGTPSSSFVSISGLGSKASHISVSPYSATGVSNIFIGTQGGKVLKVNNAHSTPTVTNITGASMPSGNVSCIAIGESDNHLLVTFSNYGVTSVWETKNGGSTWTSKEGNLPDMPVRWALFNPNDSNQAFIATEVGVWSTDDLSAGTVDWSPTNSGLANVRTDMLQLRSSDNTMLAATHGRGLFTAPIPVVGSKPVAAFTGTPTTLCEGNTVAFTDQSSNTPTSWSWTFTGGTPASSSSQNPTVTYNTAGTYTVRLIATNASGSDTITKTGYITVNAVPTTTTSSTNESCAGNDGTATATGGGTYLWDDPGSQTTSTATGLATGTYHCTVTNVAGCSTIATVVVGQDNCVDSTMLKPVSCGITAPDLSVHIWAYAVSGATSYDFEFTPLPSGTPIVINKNIDHTILAAVSGLVMGTSYSVRVRAHVGSLVGNYGQACTVTLSNIPQPQLESQYCNQSFSSLYSTVRSTYVAGATYYQYKFTPQGVGSTVTRTAYKRASVNLAKLKYSTTYDVTVRAMVNGVWGAFGPICTVTTLAPPLTQLSSGYCNQSFSSTSSQVICDIVPNATNYHYQFTPQPSGTPIDKYVQGHGYVNLGGLQYSTTYDVVVKSKVDGVWGSFGPTCTVTLGPPPPVSGPPNYTKHAEGGGLYGEVITDMPFSFHVYPNPNDGHGFSVELFNINNMQTVQLRVVDIAGRTVLEKNMVDLNKNDVRSFYMTEKLNAGVYVVQVINGIKTTSTRMIVR